MTDTIKRILQNQLQAVLSELTSLKNTERELNKSLQENQRKISITESVKSELEKELEKR